MFQNGEVLTCRELQERFDELQQGEQITITTAADSAGARAPKRSAPRAGARKRPASRTKRPVARRRAR